MFDVMPLYICNRFEQSELLPDVMELLFNSQPYIRRSVRHNVILTYIFQTQILTFATLNVGSVLAKLGKAAQNPAEQRAQKWEFCSLLWFVSGRWTCYSIHVGHLHIQVHEVPLQKFRAQMKTQTTRPHPLKNRGQKKHMNFFNINFLARTQNAPFWTPRKKFMCLISWEATPERDPHKLFRGHFGGPKRGIFGRKKFSLFFPALKQSRWLVQNHLFFFVIFQKLESVSVHLVDGIFPKPSKNLLGTRQGS